MPAYQIGDKVQLTEECGGSIGWIEHWSGGPGPEGEFHLHADWYALRHEGAMSAGPGQIAELLPGPPVYEVGQSVMLAGQLGTITAEWPDGRFLIEVEVQLTRLRGRACFGKTQIIRRHLVPSWRLAIEGN